jgi:hypothetical protein
MDSILLYLVYLLLVVGTVVSGVVMMVEAEVPVEELEDLLNRLLLRYVVELKVVMVVMAGVAIPPVVILVVVEVELELQLAVG